MATTEPVAPVTPAELHEQLTEIRNHVVKLAWVAEHVNFGPAVDIDRMLDSVIESAVALKLKVNPQQYGNLMKRVRKALGYTYP